MNKVVVNNYEMAYREKGSGIPLLLIHGYPLSSAMWQPQLEGLSEVARVIAPDLRGHGESQSLPGPYTMDSLAQDCDALLDALGIQEPVVVGGLSMGGYVALAYTRQRRARLRGLILAATRANADPPEGRANRDKAAAQARQEGTAAVSQGMLPKMMSPHTYAQRPELVQQAQGIMESISLQGMVGDLMGMKERPDSTPTLGDLRLPTLILHGADDQLIPASAAEGMRQSIPGARLEILPQAGHLLNLEQPERFNAAVRRFLEEI